MTSPTRHIHLDPVGGVAGDMLIAALLDAFPEHESAMRAAVAAAGLPEGWVLHVEAYGDGVLTGRRFQVRGPEMAAESEHADHHHHHHHAHGHAHAHTHGHAHAEAHAHTHTRAHTHAHTETHAHTHATGRWADIRARLEAAPLAAGVRARAIAIFTLIAEAEARVHGKAVEDVSFHEIADWDSIADVVGAAAVIEALGPTTWSLAPLPLGSGLVNTAHGPVPVPAPATALLLAGLPVIDDGIDGERVTPTGAALMRHLAPTSMRPAGLLTISGVGTGFGTRRLPGRSNVLRALVLEREAGDQTDAPALPTDRVAVLTFEVDDQSPEDLALGLDHLRRTTGVLDVLQAPAYLKKGRLATQVQVLCRPETYADVVSACLHETTTLGVRHQIMDRTILARRARGTSVGPVKVAARPGGVSSVKLEADALAGISGASHRARHRHTAGAEALSDVDDKEEPL
ncbi:LarC family nickel insertion protein [Roseospira marina]|uniref:LarC family nickel insertion protein n=1 Tax=Roseospira marina TaxID=140057 RepID=UPI0017906DE3|nr:LarC family nickel insertion protein [Roseospira marina]MBB4313155.1 hypothetical protein [Roseospira marina]